MPQYFQRTEKVKTLNTKMKPNFGKNTAFDNKKAPIKSKIKKSIFDTMKFGFSKKGEQRMK